jgi:hypothetical protein
VKTKRRRIVRRSSSPSQAVLNRRMREIWIDGFGLHPFGEQINPDMLRIALMELVSDDLYWIDMKQLIDQKQKVKSLMEQLKTPPRAFKNQHFSQPKEAK